MSKWGNEEICKWENEKMGKREIFENRKKYQCLVFVKIDM